MTTTSTTRCFKRGHTRRVGAQGEHFDFFFRIDAGLFDHHARGDVRCRAETADAEGFAFEILERFEFRLGDQRHRPVVEKAGDDPHRQPGNGAADHGAEELAVIDIAGGQRRDRDVGIHADDLGVEIFVFEKARLRAPSRRSDSACWDWKPRCESYPAARRWLRRAKCHQPANAG